MLLALFRFLDELQCFLRKILDLRLGFSLLKTAHTKLNLSLLSVNKKPERFKIRFKKSFCSVVGVRDVIPYRNAFATNFTNSSHIRDMLTHKGY